MSEKDDYYGVYYNVVGDYIFVAHDLSPPKMLLLLGEVVYLGEL